MSVLRKKPYIEEQLAKLTGPQLVQLRTAMNNNGPETFYSLVDSSHFIPENQDIIAAVRLEVEREKPAYNGILISTSDVCMLIGYHRFQDLALFEIDLYERTYRRIKEYCDINELRRCLDDALETEVPDFDVTAETIDSGSATSGQVLTANGEGGAAWTDAGGGLPEATKGGQVLITDDELLQPIWADAAPLADNLLAAPVNNDALYSKGPTGGLADITTGEESYLQEIKGYSIVWNQLLDSEHSSHTLDSSHIYIFNNQNVAWNLMQNSTQTLSFNGSSKLFDLTLMFGGNDEIPFSLTPETEYPANGAIPSQTAGAVIRFQRLFANVDLANASYDAGTIKNVKVTELVETGRNLWDASTMESTGLQLLAGYRYEIYVNSLSSHFISSSSDNGNTWTSVTISRYQRADGKYIWTYQPDNNMLIKSASGSIAIVYVGFVHSGNYCLTTGTINDSNGGRTDVTIPAYHKYEFFISGIDGLNGLTNSEGNVTVYDTKDYRRVGSMNLADYANVMTYDSAEEGWIIAENDLPSDFDVEYQQEHGTFLFQNGYIMGGSGNDIVIDNGSNSVKPTGILLYPLTEPVATGESAFQPIPLKAANDWIVDDMGQEYFIQPSNTNCPVNQVSYYYENLKDKLVNLQEPIEVAAASYSATYTALNGLKIGTTLYKLIPSGNNGGNYYALAIGDASSAVNAYSLSVGIGSSSKNGGTGIGAQSDAPGNSSVALGQFSYAGGQYGISLGSYTKSKIPNVFAFDGDAGTIQRTIMSHSPSKVFFRFANNNQSASSLDFFTSGHFLSEYIQLNDLMSITDFGGSGETITGGSKDSNSGNIISTKVFNGTEINAVKVEMICYDGAEDSYFCMSGIVHNPAKFNGAEIVTQLSTHAVGTGDHSYIEAWMDSTSGSLCFSLTPMSSNITNAWIKYHLL